MSKQANPTAIGGFVARGSCAHALVPRGAPPATISPACSRTARSSLVMDPDISEDNDLMHPSPITEVSYMLREGQDGYYELCRRESPFVDDEPFKGGYFRLICDRVLSFKVQYTGWDFGATDENSPFGEQAGRESQWQ